LSRSNRRGKWREKQARWSPGGALDRAAEKPSLKQPAPLPDIAAGPPPLSHKWLWMFSIFCLGLIAIAVARAIIQAV